MAGIEPTPSESNNWTRSRLITISLPSAYAIESLLFASRLAYPPCRGCCLELPAHRYRSAGLRRTSHQTPPSPLYLQYSPAGPATTVFKRIPLLPCLNRSIFLEPAEAPNSRKAAFAQPLAGSHRVSIAPLGPPASGRFRVLQRTEQLLRPAPPKDCVGRRVEWRMMAWAGRRIPRGSADALVP
jgi:hypothetical protein